MEWQVNRSQRPRQLFISFLSAHNQDIHGYAEYSPTCRKHSEMVNGENRRK
jgi:hypothetical protein